MSRARKILLADPDAEVQRELARALRERGHQVSVAGDGSRALEVSVLRHPDVVLFDADCRLVDARTFVQILRTNPRTEDIPVLVTGSAKDAERLRFLRDGFLRKPHSLDEVLGRIAQLLRRVDAARALRSETREIEGSLKQMALSDLLQVLAVNRRSGSLSLERGELRGEIFLADGRPVNARVGPVEGEKALFRILALHEGNFAFAPGPYAGPRRIDRPVEEALLEAMRQSDEIAAMASSLPAPTDRLRLNPGAALLGEQHPVTAEVARLLAEPRSTSELLDLTSAIDFEVMAALKALLEKGIVQTAPADAAVSGPLLSAAETHSLRARVLRGRPAAREAVGKVALLSESQRTTRAFLDRIRTLPGFRLQRYPTPELLGTWARIDLSDGLRLELCSIPGADVARPLWRPFAAGALGALALDRSEPTVALTLFLARECRTPVLLAGDGAVPAALKNVPGLAPHGGKPIQSLRGLLDTILRGGLE